MNVSYTVRGIWREFDVLDRYLLVANALIFSGVTVLWTVWHAMIVLGGTMLTIACYGMVKRG